MAPAASLKLMADVVSQLWLPSALSPDVASISVKSDGGHHCQLTRSASQNDLQCCGVGIVRRREETLTLTLNRPLLSVVCVPHIQNETAVPFQFSFLSS